MQKKRNYALDFLKIIATVIIVFHHYQSNTGVVFDGINFYYGRFYFGYLVELFFIISGFFTYGYIDKILGGLSFRDFYYRRAIRLLPLVSISAIAYSIADLFFFRYVGAHYPGVTNTLWGIVITSLGVQSGWVFADPKINGAVWYISVLLLCYVLFYLIVLFSKCKFENGSKNAALCGCLVMIFAGIAIQTYGIQKPFLNDLTGRGYYSFFFGILLHDYLQMHRPTKVIYLACLTVICGITGLIVYVPAAVEAEMAYVMTFLYFPACIILLNSKVAQRIFNGKWIGRLAEISFNVYIWHTVFIVLMYVIMVKYNLEIVHTYGTMFAFTAIVYVFGTASHYLIEKPLAKVLAKRN